MMYQVVHIYNSIRLRPRIATREYRNTARRTFNARECNFAQLDTSSCIYAKKIYVSGHCAVRSGRHQETILHSIPVAGCYLYDLLNVRGLS